MTEVSTEGTDAVANAPVQDSAPQAQQPTGIQITDLQLIMNIIFQRSRSTIYQCT